MAEVSRERKALVILVVMMAATVALMAAYFLTGRTWNVAASFLDDSAGQLQGYTVIAYSGTQHRIVDEPKSDSSAALDPDRSLLASQLETFADALDSARPETLPRFVSDIRSTYEKEGASVLTLDLSDPSRYEDPTVFTAGGKRVAVFSLPHAIDSDTLEDVLASCHEEKVGLVVCVAEKQGYLPDNAGIDILILTGNQNDVPTTGIDSRGTFIIAAPEFNAVGVVLVTANNVMSARVFTP